jgi:hypothetical protein
MKRAALGFESHWGPAWPVPALYSFKPSANCNPELYLRQAIVPFSWQRPERSGMKPVGSLRQWDGASKFVNHAESGEKGSELPFRGVGNRGKTPGGAAKLPSIYETHGLARSRGGNQRQPGAAGLSRAHSGSGGLKHQLWGPLIPRRWADSDKLGAAKSVTSTGGFSLRSPTPSDREPPV